MEKFAHLRHLVATDQCELVVCFNIDFHNIPINNEMHSVRKVTDTVGSMIEHTKNKLRKVINDKASETNDNSIPHAYDIPISFFRRRGRRVKPINEHIILKDFLNSNPVNAVIEILGEKFKILVNPPFIKSMSLPSILYASYCIQPSKFYGLYIDRNQSQYTWYRSKDKVDWNLVGNEHEYRISLEDIGFYLKLICVPVSLDQIKGPPAESISQRTVQGFPTLPKCPFEVRHEHTKNLLCSRDFRFITYNTLSNRYTELNDAFSYCPLEFLAIDYRKQLIMKELIGYNADIICLQEMDNREYSTYFNAKFSEQGFVSKFHRKGNYLPEGLLCAVKKSRFKLISYQQVVLANALQTKKIFQSVYRLIKKNIDLKNLFMRQPTSLQVIVLKCKEVKTLLVIGNTHLYYHPDATCIRIIQAYMAVQYLSYVKQRMEAEWKNFEVAIIMCGDLNSSPDGVVYKFLSEGKIPTESEFCLQFSSQDLEIFTHNLNFVSACGTPKYTNYTNDFKSCLDYIFIEKDKLEVDSMIPLPEDELEQYIGLPNEIYPSDHIALVANLKIKEIV